MSKFVFDVTYAVTADTSEQALLRLMAALDGVEHYGGGDKVEFVYVDGGEEVEADDGQ